MGEGGGDGVLDADGGAAAQAEVAMFSSIAATAARSRSTNAGQRCEGLDAERTAAGVQVGDAGADNDVEAGEGVEDGLRTLSVVGRTQRWWAAPRAAALAARRRPHARAQARSAYSWWCLNRIPSSRASTAAVGPTSCRGPGTDVEDAAAQPWQAGDT